MVAFDPSEDMLSAIRSATSPETIITVAETSGFEDHSFDRIACLEVLEHMSEKEQVETLRQIHRLLTGDGRLLISVPIEIGPSAVAKNLARQLSGHPHQGVSVAGVVRSALCLRVEREAVHISHIGFDHRALRRLFPACGWEIESTVCSPWPLMGSLLNSQIFFVLRPAAASVLSPETAT